MRSLPKVLLLFFAMYVVATILGFASYLLISPVAMWITVFTIMPLVAALLIRVYLLETHCPAEKSLQETMILVAVWITLSFLLDAATYIFVIPFVEHTARNWAFFVDQSPWIWLSYGVLILSGIAGRWLYLAPRKKADA